MRVYPLTVEPDDNGTLLVAFVDIPEAHTFTDDEAQITARATDCALTALEGVHEGPAPDSHAVARTDRAGGGIAAAGGCKDRAVRSDAECRRAQSRTGATLAVAHATGRSPAESPPRYSP